MSDNHTPNPESARRPQLSLCIFTFSGELAGEIGRFFSDDRYGFVQLDSDEAFFQHVLQEQHQIDCLVLQEDAHLDSVIPELKRHDVFVPAVILYHQANLPSRDDVPQFYHDSEVRLRTDQLDRLGESVNKAISQFITKAVTLHLTDESTDEATPASLYYWIMRQQKRLADKLRERLGYLGVYYKRDTRNFLRHLSSAEQQQFIEQLEFKYRQIILTYFADDRDLNNKIDEYVNMVFFADVPVTRIVEIHMNLMDNFSKQLKLEGRNEDVLLDYRLTLIDTIAHLCEMYRRSIPRED